jgi:tRNA A-37 threonylcarbamoyl transferase component Bud32
MKDVASGDISIGGYRGSISPDHESGELIAWAQSIASVLSSPEAKVLAEGRNRNVLVDAPCKSGNQRVVIKSFGRQPGVRDMVNRFRGSKARRTWLAASHLCGAGIGTPRPVCFLEKWSAGRLLESYFVSEYCEDTSSFKDELIRLFRHDPECAKFMTIMQVVADAIRTMHDAGFAHNDLGNQNILLNRVGNSDWENVRFIDLNRGRCSEDVTIRQRARDISRIYLPSDLLRVFIEMYWRDVPPEAFLRMESFYRRRYALHAATREIRHPVRYRGIPRESEDSVYPAGKDMWIWDERSGQPLVTMVSKDRRRFYPFSRHLGQLLSTVRHIFPVWSAYRDLLANCYREHVDIGNRVAVAISGREELFDHELELLEELGPVPVHLRFYYHEDRAAWEFSANAVRQLSEEGRKVSISLVQSRTAVLDPVGWGAFASYVLDRVAETVDWVEVGHAVNRVKWGIWGFDEYRSLLDPICDLKASYPALRFTGPAVIDFEYHFALAALDRQPEAMHYGAMSHHLYVDRRGAPENHQGQFSSLEKFALARAIARTSEKCDDHLVVSEVNWPLKGTGVFSPVGAPYESPGERKNDPSVSEDEYADYMLRYILIATCSGMVERVVWWQLVAHGYGIVDDSPGDHLRKRPAFHVLKVYMARTGNATFQEKLETPEGVHAFRFDDAGGGSFYIAYSEESGDDWTPGFKTGRITDSLGEEVGGDREQGSTIRLTGRPVYVEIV